MPSISLTAGQGAALAGAGSLAGGGISALGSFLGAGQQQKALQSGIQTQIAEQENFAGLLQPYLALGAQGANALGGNLGTLTKPFSMTQDQLTQTPGYQFTLQQGEQGVANLYSGQGMGSGVTTGATAATPSGPGVKGALNYAEGLASQTFQQQFQNYWNQNANIYAMLQGTTDIGRQAASAWGGVASTAANAISGLQSATGASQSAQTQGISNALGGGLSNATGALGNYALLNAYGSSLFGNTSAQGTSQADSAVASQGPLLSDLGTVSGVS